jgi:exosome complex exonuclease DIS3/RRP44
MFKRETQFDPENYIITIPSPSSAGGKDITISVFDKVTVNIEVEKDKNTQRGRVKMTLVRPLDSLAL